MDNAARGGVRAIVEHDYSAKQRDELTLVKGAIIQNIKTQPGGWWEGQLLDSGKSGMFPDNFVRVLEPDENNPVILRDKTATPNRRCKVVYSYTQNNNDELSLAVGDIIEVIEEVEEGWWRGKLFGKVGVFPSNFVVLENELPMLAANRLLTTTSATRNRMSVTSSREDLMVGGSIGVGVGVGVGISLSSVPTEKDAPSLPPKPVRDLCTVLFPYEPLNDDELELIEGDVITILSRDISDKGWWRGELRGKIGVFPDNFVTMLSSEGAAILPSPTRDGISKPERPPPATKMLVNRSPMSNTNRKDSFGSKDSLNDSGIVSGNVAAYRKSLESKTTTPDVVAEKPPRKSFDSKLSSELRKSAENLDEKKATPPPVLTKKPSVPIKKSPTLSSVTGNLFSGLKQKVKSVEQKLIAGNDTSDGLISSKPSGPQVADTGERGIAVERMRRDDVEFDQVERSSILQDMRANRAKAPKRRPPSAAINIVGEHGIAAIMNGSNGAVEISSEMRATDSLSTSQEDDLAKPKAREWEKHKAPWMEELKASQAKKTSPSFDPPQKVTPTSTTENVVPLSPLEMHEKYDMSKSFSTPYVGAARLNRSADSSAAPLELRTNSVDVKSGSAFDVITKKDAEHPMTKSMTSLATKISINDATTTSHDEAAVVAAVVAAAAATSSASSASLSSSLSSSAATAATAATAASTTTAVAAAAAAAAVASAAPTTANMVAAGASANGKPRPTSVNLRQRSISPLGSRHSMKTVHISPDAVKIVSNNMSNHNTDVSGSSSGDRVAELESRIVKLERIVHSQGARIDDLVKILRDETDKVRILKTELDKYAQCVTQV